ncbi:hypothetical protein JSE7799_02580 [Jannaschia seosinensis]|uniref:Uncharacterized protein n=1 Tax=Jannaschia seosinensis TaxID=313367 RepID=A0A0M7BDI1_9RHOB|nr:hypothetical protein [Jannaschia seosinensis]CUH39852.1 hypothetical protein JSE7799_02580 [Jannaschia seosinensis]
MRKTILANAAMLGLVGAVAAQEALKLVTLLTAPEPQTQLMAMAPTMQAAQQGTHILLSAPAGDIALVDTP